MLDLDLSSCVVSWGFTPYQDKFVLLCVCVCVCNPISPNPVPPHDNFFFCLSVSLQTPISSEFSILVIYSRI